MSKVRKNAKFFLKNENFYSLTIKRENTIKRKMVTSAFMHYTCKSKVLFTYQLQAWERLGLALKIQKIAMIHIIKTNKKQNE